MTRGTIDGAKHAVRNGVLRLLRRCKFLLGNDPLFLPVFLRLTPLGISRAITDSTDLVIEGFPRCGNTFTVTAMQYAADHRIQIASHVHHPAQVKLAHRLGVPTLIVVRDPRDALASYLTYGQHGRTGAAIAEYCSYHRELLPYLDEVLISDFAVNVTNLSETIARVNERFDLAIPPFDQSPENVERVFDEISRFHKLTHRTLDPSSVAPRPNAARKEAADQVRAELDDPRFADLMAQARDLYDYYLLKAEEQRRKFEQARWATEDASVHQPPNRPGRDAKRSPLGASRSTR